MQVIGKKQNSETGFVLPLAMMLLLVLSLSVTTILLRSGQQSEQVLTTREDKKVYNTAAPAVDRAKAKIEYYFNEDAPAGEPAGAAIENSIKDDNKYTLPDEARIDINGDGTLDNAWVYETDLDGDGNSETVAYSILTREEGGGVSITDNNLALKAQNLVTRSGPLNIQANSTAGACAIEELKTGAGWYKVNEASIRKSFQINAVVANKNAANRSVVAMEFQQDRQMDKGNKWAAWFRYDLEIFPGPDFNWNGAIHTGGNLMLGQQTDKIKLHLISSPKSCLYTEDASEISLAEYLKDDGSNQIEFQGQIMAFSSTANTFTGNAKVYLYPGAGKEPNSPQTLDSGTDSVKNNGKPYDYSLDPIVLFTEDKSLSRYSADKSNASARDPNWNNSNLNKRIFNKLQKKPYVDDTYRADDLYGPKPRYSPPGSNIVIKVTAANNGQLIGSADAEIMTKKNINPGNEEGVGLDGYWERRARNEGLRLIVGQRLELGNAFGWRGNNDPLYPINDDDGNLDSEQRQRKTLRDNLAAVQSMVVYHQANSDKDFPVACMAFTAHPGNNQTITNSTTFTETTINGTTRLNADFLNGTGTNGWEFNAPGNVTSSSAFAAKIADGEPLRIALSNLAHFAGDPDGAFPPKQETSGTTIHPYPQLTMWGNYSNLRRVIDRLDSGVSYDDLSIADQSTLHTASCTLGMLAYNVKNAEDEYDSALASATDATIINDFADYMWKLVDGVDNATNREIHSLVGGYAMNAWPTGYNRNNPCVGTAITCAANFYGQFTTDQYKQAIAKDSSNLTPTQQTNYTRILDAFKNGLAVKNDRLYGFANNPSLNPSTGVAVNWSNNTTGVSPTAVTTGTTATLRVSCDPDTFASSSYLTNLSGLKSQQKISLAMVFCPAYYPARKYPALYYLFPKNNHDHDGTNFDGNGNVVTLAEDDQPGTPPTAEEYIADGYIQGVNAGYIKHFYKVLNDNSTVPANNNNGKEDADEDGLGDIELKPRYLSNNTAAFQTSQPTAWQIPYTTSNTNIRNIITSQGAEYYVPFLDKGIFEGRELMATRVLDVDLNILRNNNIGSDTWLPKTGMVYAFREDAVREDAIARPASKTWAECGTEAKLTTDDASCRMRPKFTNPQDPPRNADTGVSPKPADFYPDPERRPYGFRLRNGSNLSRPGDRGLSFISDQPVYIQGNFNLHTSGTNVLEEFTQLLENAWGNFYQRTTLSSNFAKPSSDRWRPSEIISDAVNILSDNFCDGNLESGLRNNNSLANCQNTSGRSSYLNSTFNGQPGTFNEWVRENPLESKDGTENNQQSPILVNRNGFPRYYTNATNKTNDTQTNFTNYKSMESGRTLGSGVGGQRVNTIIVSGLVPSRPGSSYGGLHNFPRFLENWGSDLFISGSFIQLNFSTYATGLFDQEKLAWEPSGSGQSGEKLPHYSPPNRRWGYDVALQYNPPGPVAARFVSQGTPRSEFYRELPIDDPYIKQLRCAANPNGGFIDQNATDCN